MLLSRCSASGCVHLTAECTQIGYCGLDRESLGAGPDAASLDITEYCEGYVSWDLLMVFIQVLHRSCRPSCNTARQTVLLDQQCCVQSRLN